MLFARNRFFITSLLILLVTGSYGQGVFSRKLPATPEVLEKPDRDIGLEKYIKALSIVNQYYVDSVDNSKLAEQAIKGMLKELDPHSLYFTAEQIKRANEGLDGTFDGVGIEFQFFDDTAVVVMVVSGGPAYKAGVKQGDRILKVGKEDATVSGKSANWISNRVRGEAGTNVEFTVLRHGVVKPLELKVTRGKVSTYSIATYYMVDNRTGYVKISRFMKTTISEFEDALRQLKRNNIESLILDLRGNTGGLLNAAIMLSNHFIEPNRLIVYTYGLNNQRAEYRTTLKGNYRKGRVIVLIDEGSASASEIVTGAIQDWDRGLVMGRRSFGKGLVQKPYLLPDGSTIRLTIARYYTPTGRSIQRPYDKGYEAYYKELNEKIKKGEYSVVDSMKLHDSLKYATPGGRIVYGGGGIMPDILFPADTTKVTLLVKELNKKNLFNRYALNLAVNHRDSLLGKYPKVEVFLATPISNDPLVQNFVKFAQGYEFSIDAERFKESQNQIEQNIRILISKFIYGNPASVQTQCYYDPMIERARITVNNPLEFHKHGIKEVD